jgi:hypothetical protein
MEHYNQAVEIVKFVAESFASGAMSQAGKELLTIVKDRFIGQNKAELAISQLETTPHNTLEAVKILEVLLEAEIIKDDFYADRLRQLMGTIMNERSQEAAIDLNTTESVEVGKIEQSIQGNSAVGQVAAKNITAKSIKIGDITQTKE